MRETMLAIAAAIALGTATTVTGAMAAPRGAAGGFGHAGPGAGIGRAGPGAFGHRGPGVFGRPGPGGLAMGRPGPGPGHFAFRGGRFHGRFYGPGVGLYAYGGPWYGGGCWLRRLVWTPFGWRWRLVDVCD